MVRTTIDIDDNLLAIDRVRSRSEGVSLGAVVSAMMRRGLSVPVSPSPIGFPVFAAPPGAPVVTDELAAHHRDEGPEGA